MCGGGAPKPVKTDPEADAERVAAEAAVAANSASAARRKTRRQSALLTLGGSTTGQAPGATSSVINYGSPTLGG